MNLDDLEEMLAEVLPAGFSIETDNHGQLIVYTGLRVDDDGEIEDFEPEDDDGDGPDLDGGDEDFEPLEEEDSGDD
jgi:hypothetical protein